MTTPTPPPSDIACFMRLMFAPGDVFEVRAPKCRQKAGTSFTSTASGYYTHAEIDAAARDVVALDAKGLAPGIYVSLNPVNPALLGRATNTLKDNARETTADADVVARRRLLIDTDPVRASGISSTDEELRAAEERLKLIVDDLRSQGWPEPVIGMSGNG